MGIITATDRQGTGLLAAATAFWPSLPFMAFGLWSAWSSLTYSGSLWLSENEVDGTSLSQLYIISTFSCALVFLVSAVLARRGVAAAVANNRIVMAGGLVACAGCLVIIAVGPYYLRELLTPAIARVFSGLVRWRRVLGRDSSVCAAACFTACCRRAARLSTRRSHGLSLPLFI